MHTQSPLPTLKARVLGAGGRRNLLLALVVVLGLALLLASATLLRENGADDDGVTGGRTHDYDFGDDDDGAAELDCAADIAPAAARRVFFSLAQPSPPPPRTRVIYFVPVEGATPLCALRSLGLVTSRASSDSTYQNLGGRKISLPASERDGNSSISNITISSNNDDNNNTTTASTSDDIPRFRELLEMRERHQRLHGGMIFDAWYHAPLRSDCVWRIFRDWLLGNSSDSGRSTWRPEHRREASSTILPPGPQLTPWTANDLAFANKLAPESRFVVLGGRNTSKTLPKAYTQYRETCGDDQQRSRNSLQQPALRDPRLVCANAAEIEASRMSFVDCSQQG
jgi:hypothetical protein